MGFRDNLKKRFGSAVMPDSVVIDDTPAEAITEPGRPEPCECGGRSFWLPKKNATAWRCGKCDRPASDFFVKRWLDLDVANVVDFCITTFCMPWCSCGCWQAIETEFDSGETTTVCRSCGADMPHRPADPVGYRESERKILSGRKRGK